MKFTIWLSIVACRLQWLFAIPLTKRQQAARDQMLAEFDASFRSGVTK